MQKFLVVCMGIFLLSPLGTSQELPTLFKANSFIEAYYNPAYQELKYRKDHQLKISEREQGWLSLYEDYLNQYLLMLPEAQQKEFAAYRTQLRSQSNLDSLVFRKKETYPEDIQKSVETERNTELLLGHIIFSGLSGITYGLQLSYIFDLDNPTTITGLTMLMAGGSMLVPIFSKAYDNINSNSLWLRSHGKIVGGLYGYFLAAALVGDKVFETYEWDNYGGHAYRNNKPLAISMSLLGSFSMGQLGFYLGKNKPWSDGRVAMYQYYGYALPALITTTYAAWNNGTRTRTAGLLISLSTPIGYLGAHQLAKQVEYSRGDMTATIGNAALGTIMGASVLAFGEYDNSKSLFIPIGGAVLGTVVGQYTFRNFHIERAQGRRLNYAAIGGGLIGLGVTFLGDPDNDGYYLLLPALFGAGGYSILLNHYYKQPQFTWNNQRFQNVHFSVHPENIYLNKLLPPAIQAPLVSLRVKL